MVDYNEKYKTIKAKHPDSVLLFRVGDFYESFNDDAVDLHKILGIALVRRSFPSGHVDSVGFPRHGLDTYLPKIVRAGKRVEIC